MTENIMERWTFTEGDKTDPDYYYNQWSSYQNGQQLEVVEYETTFMAFVEETEVNAVFGSAKEAMECAEHISVKINHEES